MADPMGEKTVALSAGKMVGLLGSMMAESLAVMMVATLVFEWVVLKGLRLAA